MAILASIIKLLTLIGEGFTYFLRQKEAEQARRDGENAKTLEQIKQSQDIEQEFRHAQGKIEEASKPVGLDGVRERLRNRTF
jgi:uncharacterized protein HemX